MRLKRGEYEVSAGWSLPTSAEHSLLPLLSEAESTGASCVTRVAAVVNSVGTVELRSIPAQRSRRSSTTVEHRST